MTELLKQAKLYENSTLTKRGAVSAFGTEGQREHFTKYKRFNNKKIEEALIKTLNQVFESVEKVKSGRRVDYKVGAARENIVERESNVGNRDTNGNWNPQTKHLDAIILAQLEWCMKNGGEIEMTTKSWMYSFGLINDEQLDLINSGYSEDALDNTKRIIHSYIESETQVGGVVGKYYHEARNFFYNDYLSKKNTMMSTLRRLEKENIIKILNVAVAYLEEPQKDGTFTKQITSSLFQEYKDKEVELLTKYNLERHMLSKTNMYKENSNKKSENDSYQIYSRILEYQKELQKYLHEDFLMDESKEVIKPIKVRNIGTKIGIIRIAKRERVAKYLEKHSPEILAEYMQHKEDEEKYFKNQAEEFRIKNRQTRLNKINNRKHKELTEAIEKDSKIQWFSEQPREPKDYINTRRTENYFLDVVALVDVLDWVFCENFKMEPLENKMYKRKNGEEELQEKLYNLFKSKF